MNGIVLAVLVCMTGSDTDCAEFKFTPSQPVTMEQCTAHSVLAAGQIAAELPAELYIKSWKCVNLNEQPT